VSANLDLVRSIYADWERGDYSDVDWAHPEIEFEWVGGLGGSWTGVAGMAEGWRDVLSTFDGWHTVPDEFRELDDERVLVLVRGAGRGKSSGAPINTTERRCSTSGAERWCGLSPIQKASAPSPISGWRARLSANLDLVRSICAPWERGDYSSATWAHPEIELVILKGRFPGPGTA
jgi:ketosteroid isomerase-like protein